MFLSYSTDFDTTWRCGDVWRGPVKKTAGWWEFNRKPSSSETLTFWVDFLNSQNPKNMKIDVSTMVEAGWPIVRSIRSLILVLWRCWHLLQPLNIYSKSTFDEMTCFAWFPVFSIGIHKHVLRYYLNLRLPDAFRRPPEIRPWLFGLVTTIGSRQLSVGIL